MQFCRAAIKQGHEIYRVFLYRDGIHLSTRLATPPQDELNIYSEWQTFSAENNIEIITCIAAAARRGLIDESEAKRHNKDTHNMHLSGELSGLGQLIEAHIIADRLVTFGA
ncbi:hypothetical protein A3760_23550 [Oleiphilus sp. HI0122]|nr:hypothetical protein A3760_23550 [Oleiphilus sp. HI0122]